MFDPLMTTLGALFLAAFVAGLGLTPLARRLALRLGLQDQPGERKIHAKSIPYGGGIAIYATTTAMLALAGAAVLWVDLPKFFPAFGQLVQDYASGIRLRRTHIRLGAILLGGTMMFILGLWDDKRGLRPRVKLAVQALAALLLVAAGIRITFFIDSLLVSVVLTVLWIIFVTNAFNLLDNMDGLSAGVAAIASLLLLVVALQGGRLFVAAFLAVFAGALLGFLRYNFTPARIFMGDAGSLFAGFILASLTVASTYYEQGGTLYAVCMPVLILGVPLFDTVSVMWLRWRRGAPLFQGDTNHLSHRLVRLGMTRREAVLTIYLLALILGGTAMLLRQLDAAGAITILSLALGMIALIAMLETAAARRIDAENQESPSE